MNKETKSQEAFLDAIDSGFLPYRRTTQTNHSSTRIVGVPNAQRSPTADDQRARLRRVWFISNREGDQASETDMKKSNPTNYADLGSKPVLRITEAAQYLGIAEKTARRLARAKTIPSFQLGRRIMCSRVALDEMVANLGGIENE